MTMTPTPLWTLERKKKEMALEAVIRLLGDAFHKSELIADLEAKEVKPYYEYFDANKYSSAAYITEAVKLEVVKYFEWIVAGEMEEEYVDTNTMA